MSWQTLTLRYAGFACLATLANLATQRAVFTLGDSIWIFALAIGLGTLIGLVLKYNLDKIWIFADTGHGVKDHGRKFSLYTLMGVVTTVIFWSTETLFWQLWKTDLMREVGAVLGLSIGYVIKYHLDRSYVFIDVKKGLAR